MGSRASNDDVFANSRHSYTGQPNAQQARTGSDERRLPTLPGIQQYLHIQEQNQLAAPPEYYHPFNGPYSPVFTQMSPASASDSGGSRHRSSVATSIGSTEQTGYGAATGPLASHPEPHGTHDHFPIRASVENRLRGHPQDDPLLSGLQDVGAKVPVTLRSILNTPPPTLDSPRLPSRCSRDARALTAFCRGATGVGGSLAPGGAAGSPTRESVSGLPHLASPSHPQGVRAAEPNLKHPRSPNDEQSAFSKDHHAHPQDPIKEENDDSAKRLRRGKYSPASPTKDMSKSKAKPKGPGTKPKQEFKSSFHFVVNKSGDDARKMVRKHVMKEFRRKERWEQGFESDHDTPDSLSPQDQSNTLQNHKAASIGKTLKRRRTSTKADTPSSGPDRRSSDDASVSPTTVVTRSSARAFPAVAEAKRVRLASPNMDEEALWQLHSLVPHFDKALEELEARHDLPYQADPYAAVAASDVDPFSRLNLELGPATKSLLHHFAWVMPSLMDEIVTGTVFNRIGWLYSAVAVHDPTPAHVILGFTLGHLAMLRGQEEPAVAIEHKSQALKLIQNRMDSPDEATSNESIGAVVNIAGYELVACDPKAFSLHMAGLHRMVVARGGMAVFREWPELETVLIRLDAIRAYIAVSAPRYPLYASVRPLKPLAIDIPACDASRQPLQYFEYPFCEDMIRVIHSLEDLLLLLYSASVQLTGPIRRPNKELVALAIQQFLSTTDLPFTIWSIHISRKCARLAALAFIDAAIQEFFDGDIPSTHTRNLKRRFLGLSAGVDKSAMATWGRSLEMVIAVLMTADRFALERPWRGWYFADALTIIMKLGMDRWDTVHRELMAHLKDRSEEAPAPGARSAELWDLKSVLDTFEKEWAQFEIGERVSEED